MKYNNFKFNNLKFNKKLYIFLLVVPFILLCISSKLLIILLMAILFGIIGLKVTILLLKNPFIALILQLTFTTCEQYLVYNCNLPSYIKLISEYLLIIILIRTIIDLYSNKSNKINNKNKKLYIYILVIFLVIIINTLFKTQNVQYSFKRLYLDYIRFFIMIFCYMNINIDKKKMYSLIKYYVGFVLLQVPLTIYQYISLRGSMYLFQDYVSGTMGEKSTGELGFHIIIVINIIIVLYLKNKIKLLKVFILIAILFIPLIIAEIKFAIPLLFLTMIITVSTKINLKNIIIMVVMAMVSLFAMYILVKIYPMFKGLFNIDILKENLTNSAYSSTFGIDRGTGPRIAFNLIKDNFSNLMFGVGIGMSEMISHYKIVFRMFYFPYILAETGIFGIVSVLTFYFYLILKSIKAIKNKECYLLGEIMIIIVACFIFSGFYNQAMVKACFYTFPAYFIGLLLRQGKSRSHTEDVYGKSQI